MNLHDKLKRRLSVRFCGTFVALCLLAFTSALNVAIITTALPNITDSVGGASQYVWIANSLVVASAVLQPLPGQVSNALGRRGPLTASTALFALSSGIAGGVYNATMLIPVGSSRELELAVLTSSLTFSAAIWCLCVRGESTPV